MANGLNTFPCALLGANVGFGSCTVDFKNITGFVIVPSGVSFSQSNTASQAAFLTALQTACAAPKGSRAYPVSNIGEFKDNSESAVKEKLGYGAEIVVRDGNYNWSFRIIKGGFCLSKALRQFNNMNVDVFFIDANSLVIGQRLVSSAGVVSFGGIPQYQAYQETLKINDGSKNTQYWQDFCFAGNEFDSFGGFQMNPGDFNLVQGLQPVYLSSATRTTNVSVVGGSAGCVGIDLGLTFGSALAVADLWSLQDAVTGAIYDPSTGITSVSYSASTNKYTITADTSDPAYHAGNQVIVSLAAPSVLVPAIGYYESNTIVTTAP